MEIPRTVTDNSYEVDEIAAAVLLQRLMLELAEDSKNSTTTAVTATVKEEKMCSSEGKMMREVRMMMLKEVKMMQKEVKMMREGKMMGNLRGLQQTYDTRDLAGVRDTKDIRDIGNTRGLQQTYDTRDLSTNKVKLEDSPGPGNYEPLFSKVSTKMKTRDVVILSSKDRHSYIASVKSPGPGHYEEGRAPYIPGCCIP